MAKEAGDRDASVEELGGYISRYLTHYPVHARRQTFGYVARRFARRHRVALAVSAIVGASAITSLGVMLRQMQLTLEGRGARRASVQRRARTGAHVHVRRARRHRERAGDDAGARVAGADDRGVPRLAAAEDDDWSLQCELAAAYVKVGDAQGHPTSASIGDTAGARASYERAIAIAG